MASSVIFPIPSIAVARHISRCAESWSRPEPLPRNVETNQAICLLPPNRAQTLDIIKADTVGKVRIIDNTPAAPSAGAARRRRGRRQSSVIADLGVVLAPAGTRKATRTRGSYSFCAMALRPGLGGVDSESTSGSK